MAPPSGTPADQMGSCRKRGVDSTLRLTKTEDATRRCRCSTAQEEQPGKLRASARSVPARLATGEQGANRTTGECRDSAQHRLMRDFLTNTSVTVPRSISHRLASASRRLALRTSGPYHLPRHGLLAVRREYQAALLKTANLPFARQFCSQTLHRSASGTQARRQSEHIIE